MSDSDENKPETGSEPFLEDSETDNEYVEADDDANIGGADDASFSDDDVGEDDFIEDDFVEDDFEDDWDDTPEQPSQGGKSRKLGGSRNDLTTKLIIGIGVVLGLALIYSQLPTGNNRIPQNKAPGPPPQPTAVQTQTGKQATQQQQRAGFEGDKIAKDEQARGTMNAAGQSSATDQTGQGASIPMPPAASNLQGADNQKGDANQQSDNGSALPTPANIADRSSNAAGKNENTVKQSQADQQLPSFDTSQTAGEDNDNSGKTTTTKALSQNQKVDERTGGASDRDSERNRKVAETLSKVDERLNTVMKRLDRMDQRIGTIDERTQRDNKQQRQSAVQNQAIKKLRDQIRQLDNKIEKAQKQPRRRKDQKKQLDQETDRKYSAAANPPLSAIQQKPRSVQQQSQRSDSRGGRQVRGPDQWILRSARPGLAYIVRRSGGALKSVTIGDRITGLGRITAIYQQNRRWIVRGTQGTLRQ